MNKELEGREYIIPEDVKKHLYSQMSQQTADADGKQRAVNLVSTGKVTYGQLKRILHDMKYIDKIQEISKYNLYGGEPMERWGSTILNNDRDFVRDKKESKKNANSISSLDGERKNAFLTTHKKKDSILPPMNTIKSNSSQTSISPITSMGLFEEIEKIKKLMK